MIVTDYFSLRTLSANSNQIVNSELVFKGNPTGVLIIGTNLEAQFDYGEGYLLFITFGSPYEESLHIYLINYDLHIIDSIRLGQIYTGGILDNVRITAENQIKFSFFGNDEWTLTILSKPKWKLPNSPFAPYWSVISRPSTLSFSRSYLQLDGITETKRFSF